MKNATIFALIFIATQIGQPAWAEGGFKPQKAIAPVLGAASVCANGWLAYKACQVDNGIDRKRLFAMIIANTFLSQRIIGEIAKYTGWDSISCNIDSENWRLSFELSRLKLQKRIFAGSILTAALGVAAYYVRAIK